MRMCPVCRTAYGPEYTKCTQDGAELVADEVSLSDTLSSSSVMSLPPGGAAASPTPAPVVRSNSGSTSSPGSPATAAAMATEAAPRTDSVVGTLLGGRYQVTRKIGEGGMGVVYEARHTLIGKRVALKVLLDKYAQKADIVARLQQEARLASSIGHEHIIDITDFGETEDGRTFVVMEFLDGESLAQLLSREGPLPPMRAVSIVRQVASALGAAHGKGIVHRDIKPENVFITKRSDRDFVKVVDFGISKALRQPEAEESDSPRLTHTGMVLGTPLYMSPEQARGEDDLDHRIDIYAAGVILYELITGEVPFRGTNYLSIISQVLSAEPKPPSKVRPDLEVTPSLEAVIMRAMAKDRAHRYQSMTEFNEDLARLEHGDATVASSSLPNLDGNARRRPRRYTLALWVVGISAVVLATAAAVRPLVLSKKPATQQAAGPADVPQVEVQVTSDPAGAEIWFQAEMKGKTPQAIPLPRGDNPIELRLKLDGYQETTVKLVPDDDKQLPAVALARAIAPDEDKLVETNVSSDPPGATVYVDNEIKGKTPVDLKFEAGKKVTVSFELDGHVTLKKVITPTRADHKPIAVKLKKLAGKPPRPPKPDDKLPLCPPRNPDVPRDPLLKCRER